MFDGLSSIYPSHLFPLIFCTFYVLVNNPIVYKPFLYMDNFVNITLSNSDRYQNLQFWHIEIIYDGWPKGIRGRESNNIPTI